eukprot:Gb_22365 [translate_table: standard]
MKRTREKRYLGGNEECIPRAMLTPYPFERRIPSHQFLFLNESGDMIQPLFAPVHREGPIQTSQWYASTHAEPHDKVYYSIHVPYRRISLRRPMVVGQFC